MEESKVSSLTSKYLFPEKNEWQRKYHFLLGRIIIYEGIISTGKSTFEQSIKYYFEKYGLKGKHYPEPSNELLLRQFLSDKKKYADKFQTTMLLERFKIYREGSEARKKGCFVGIDRSFHGDQTFAKMMHDSRFMSDQEWEIYNSLLSHEKEHLRKDGFYEPDCTIYFRCSPEVAYQRLKKRNNNDEVEGYNIEYFQSLYCYYENTMNSIKNKIVLDWNGEKNLIKKKINGHEVEILSEDDCQAVLDLIVQHLIYEVDIK